jgi:hypothetical protein
MHSQAPSQQCQRMLTPTLLLQVLLELLLE